MKLLVFTDNHYSQYSSVLRSRGFKYSTRLHNQIDTMSWISELAVEKKCSLIICAGDFFDKSELNAEELTALQDIKWSSLPYYFLVGNHEMGNHDLTFSSAHLLDIIPNATVIDSPYVEGGFGYRLILLPYILESDRKSLNEYLKDAKFNNWETQEIKKTIIISHNDICGIRYGQYLSTSGFNVDEINDSCDLYINGHLHNQTQVTDKILNLGNITGQNFSEDAEKYSHCAAIVDTDTLKVELINNPHALNFYKFEILTDDDFNKLDKCNNNSIVSIKVTELLYNKCKEVLDTKNVLASRVTLIPNVSDNIKESISDILKLDHVEQFKKYILENIDNTDLLKEELSLLC